MHAGRTISRSWSTRMLARTMSTCTRPARRIDRYRSPSSTDSSPTASIGLALSISLPITRSADRSVPSATVLPTTGSRRRMSPTPTRCWWNSIPTHRFWSAATSTPCTSVAAHRAWCIRASSADLDRLAELGLCEIGDVAEVALEVAPDTASSDAMRACTDVGVNRVQPLAFRPLTRTSCVWSVAATASTATSGASRTPQAGRVR